MSSDANPLKTFVSCLMLSHGTHYGWSFGGRPFVITAMTVFPSMSAVRAAPVRREAQPKFRRLATRCSSPTMTIGMPLLFSFMALSVVRPKDECARLPVA